MRRGALAWAVGVAMVAWDGASGVAWAQTERIWHVSAADGRAAAEFGVPETDDRLILLSCEPSAAGTIKLRPELYAARKPGEETRVLFTVDGTVFERQGAPVYADLLGAWLVEVAVPRSDGLIAALRSGSRASAEFDPPIPPQGPVTFSLRGSARAIDRMLEAC